MVLYGLVEILKLRSKPLMNGRGYVVGNGRGYGVIQNNESVSQRGRHSWLKLPKELLVNWKKKLIMYIFSHLINDIWNMWKSNYSFIGWRTVADRFFTLHNFLSQPLWAFNFPPFMRLTSFIYLSTQSRLANCSLSGLR